MRRQGVNVRPEVDDAIAAGLANCLTQTDLQIGRCTVVRRWFFGHCRHASA